MSVSVCVGSSVAYSALYMYIHFLPIFCLLSTSGSMLGAVFTTEGFLLTINCAEGLSFAGRKQRFDAWKHKKKSVKSVQTSWTLLCSENEYPCSVLGH